MKFTLVQKAFNGIKCGVGVLILNAGIKMFKKTPKHALNYVCFFITLIGMLAVSLFNVNFSAVYVILFGGALGLLVTLIKENKQKKALLNEQSSPINEHNQQTKGDE